MGFTSFPRSQAKWGKTDWSRPSCSSSISAAVEEQLSKPEETNTSEHSPTSQPRFSVFGKKAKLTELNKKSLQQDTEAIQANAAANKEQQEEAPKRTTVKRNKFELHLSTKSTANYKMNQSTPPSPTPSVQSKRKNSVKFNPVFLERVCLFLETQSPCELKEAHDKQLQEPTFRIICPRWPSQGRDQYAKHIMLDKKTFSVNSENTAIRGKVMVRNLALDKSVSVRYTLNGWTTVQDVDAVFFGPYIRNTAFDVYEFVMDLGYGQLADRGEVRGKLEFAVRLTAGEDDYCDNNDGRNYQIKIICDPLNDPWANEKEETALNKTEGEQQTDAQEDEDEEEEEYFDEEEEEGVEVGEKEKHSQFTNALKGYKHAKPFHLNKRQPWLGTRYDFSHSLSLAKRAPYETWSATVKPSPSMATDYFLTKPITIKPSSPPPPLDSDPITNTNTTTTTTTEYPSSISTLQSINATPPYFHLSRRSSSPEVVAQSKPVYMSSTSAPPSPKASPTMPVATIRPPLHHHNSTSAATSFAANATSSLDINSAYYLDLLNKYCFYTTEKDTNDQQLPISSI